MEQSHATPRLVTSHDFVDNSPKYTDKGSHFSLTRGHRQKPGGEKWLSDRDAFPWYSSYDFVRKNIHDSPNIRRTPHFQLHSNVQLRPITRYCSPFLAFPLALSH